MQKFCILETLECKNSAWPYCPLDSLLSIQQMSDAEILRPGKAWMQKFCMALFSAKFTINSTTNEKCRTSASLKALDAKILHGLIFR